MWKKNIGKQGEGFWEPFSETPHEIPLHIKVRVARPACVATLFPPIHSTHHNNKALSILFLEKSLRVVVDD